MSEIETIEESQACRAAMERLAECGWSLENEDDNLALIRMWVYGRDYARAAHAAPSDAVRAAAERWESERFTTRSGHPTERTVIAVMREGFEDGYRAAFAGRAVGRGGEMIVRADSTRVVTLERTARQLLVQWRGVIDVTEDVGRLGLTLDGGPLVAEHVFMREASGYTIELRWLFSDVPPGHHTIDCRGEGVTVIWIDTQTVPVD